MLCKTQKVLDFIGGADADRTRDLLNAIQALSQLSYSPTVEGSFPAKLKPDTESIFGQRARYSRKRLDRTAGCVMNKP